jgi:AbrB family looped-hinge helix DNA binding protein
MSTVKTLAKGQIVIPAEMRKKYHIEPGTELQIMEYCGVIYLVPPVADPIVQGFVPFIPRQLPASARATTNDPKGPPPV